MSGLFVLFFLKSHCGPCTHALGMLYWHDHNKVERVIEVDRKIETVSCSVYPVSKEHSQMMDNSNK